MSTALLRFIRDRAAASATEFAVIAPVLAMTALGMIDGWSMANTSLNMHAGIQSAAKFLIQGGGTASTVQAIAMAAWKDKANGSDVTVTKACTCAGAAVDCATVNSCPVTLVPPVTTYTIVGTTSWTAPFETTFMPLSQSLTESQVVRVR